VQVIYTAEVKRSDRGGQLQKMNYNDFLTGEQRRRRAAGSHRSQRRESWAPDALAYPSALATLHCPQLRLNTYVPHTLL
jgi:hypothetical protein